METKIKENKEKKEVSIMYNKILQDSLKNTKGRKATKDMVQELTKALEGNGLGQQEQDLLASIYKLDKKLDQLSSPDKSSAGR